MRVQPASDYTALCFHGLAYVPLPGPERLDDARYRAHAAATLPAEAIEPLASDGPAIGAAFGAASMAAQWLPVLHPSVRAFLATGALETSDLREGDPSALAALQAHRCDALEWLRTDLLLIAEAYVRGAPALDDEAAELSAAAAELAALPLPTAIAIAPSLGPRGRAYPNLIVVGAPQAWWCRDATDRAVPLVLAAHEHAVRTHRADHAIREWAALRSVAHALAGTALEAAHQRWIASLDLEAVLGPLERAGAITSATADALRLHPETRASRLAALHDG